MTLKKHAFRPTARIIPMLTGLGLLTVGWTMATPVAAQVIKKGPVLYQGEPSATSGVKLSSWGSGIVTEDNKGVFDAGSMALKIVTHGLYQGASLQLAKPVDLGPYVTTKDAYLSFVVSPPPPPTPGTGGAGSPYPGGPGAGKGLGGQAGPPGEGGPGSNGSFNGRNENGGLNAGGGTVKYQTARALQNLRIVLVTSTGHQLEMLLPLDSAVDDGQWKRVSIPVALIPGIKAENAQIKEVRIFGDQPGTMRVGNIGVTVDDTPITVESLPNRDLARLSNHEFRVITKGGITPLVVSWDWDASDGIQDETQGRAVLHQFRKESLYDQNTAKMLDSIVTVTVRDLYGVKSPVTTKFSIHVTP